MVAAIYALKVFNHETGLSFFGSVPHQPQRDLQASAALGRTDRNFIRGSLDSLGRVLSISSLRLSHRQSLFWGHVTKPNSLL